MSTILILAHYSPFPSSVERLRVDVVAVSSTLSLTLSRFSSVLTFRGLPVRGRSVTAPCCSNRQTMLLIALSLGAFLT